jgi:uncharacterized protein YndB with AHSA1/START domain
VFEFETTGCAEQVWRVLTSPGSTRRFLFGMSLESTWTSRSPITACLDGAQVLEGEVLFACCPHRLSFVLASGLGQPQTYITWDIGTYDAVTKVRLCVDESGTDDPDEVERSWQPVVSNLRALLSALPL